MGQTDADSVPDSVQGRDPFATNRPNRGGYASRTGKPVDRWRVTRSETGDRASVESLEKSEILTTSEVGGCAPLLSQQTLVGLRARFL